MFNVNIDMAAAGFTVNMRPRAGATPNADGRLAEEDIEICVSICVGATRQASVLTADGKQRGQMVPVATFARPLVDFIHDARVALGGFDAEVGPPAPPLLGLVP